MLPAAQRQSVLRPSTATPLAQPRRCRLAILPLAVAKPTKGNRLNNSIADSSWGWKLVQATVAATTLQFCAAASKAANASVGGGFGAGGGFGGFGGGGGGGGDGHSSALHASTNVLGDVAEASDLVEEVILLDVGGMKCGGCVGHVKKILETQPGVTSASVNLTTETALVRVLVPRGGGRTAAGRGSGADGAALAAIGDQLAQAVSKEGFQTRLRVLGAAAAAAAR